MNNSYSSHQSFTKKKHNKHLNNLDLNAFIQETTTESEIIPERKTKAITDLSINPKLKNNLLKQGFTHLTEIQDLSIDTLLARKNLIGIAQTGTGKTAAFLVPIINGLVNSPAQNQTLIILPTRELALQVEDEFKKLSRQLELYSHCFVGGTSVRYDLKLLQRKAHVIIGTPGRLLDLYSQHALHFQDMDTLVLDEFDRLLDMGFQRDIERIVDAMTQREQTILFSATEDGSQRKAIEALAPNSIKVSAQKKQEISAQIHQELITVKKGENKLELLKGMIGKNEFTKVLVFAETKRMVNMLCTQLNSVGIAAAQIHGNRTQAQRVRALDSFSRGRVSVLLATDVAARGLHISDVSHVINYQAPKDIDSYIHRIGRTGRAGKSGVAYTFV